MGGTGFFVGLRNCRICLENFVLPGIWYPRRAACAAALEEKGSRVREGGRFNSLKRVEVGGGEKLGEALCRNAAYLPGGPAVLVDWGVVGEGIPESGRLSFKIWDRIEHFHQGVLAGLQVTSSFLEAPTQSPSPNPSKV